MTAIFGIEAQLRQRVNFFYWNLLQARESKAAYDVIYLRNVLIYFDDKAKVKVINHLRRQLKPGGFLHGWPCRVAARPGGGYGSASPWLLPVYLSE
ncbi:CheR family methyltransferase [Alishewanella longhuensis]